MIVFKLSIFLLLSAIGCIPNIQNQVKKELKINGQGKFLITFRHANFDAANCPDQMFSHAKLKKNLNAADCNTLEEFVEKGEYHKLRGDYVLNKITEHHLECKTLLLEYVNEAEILTSIPISNTFLVQCKKSQIRAFVNVHFQMTTQIIHFICSAMMLWKFFLTNLLRSISRRSKRSSKQRRIWLHSN